MLQVDEDESAQVEPDDRQTHPERLLDQKYSERHEKRAIVKNIVQSIILGILIC